MKLIFYRDPTFVLSILRYFYLLPRLTRGLKKRGPTSLALKEAGGGGGDD